MPTVALTDRFCAKRRKPRNRTNYFDKKVVGLVLRVSPAGSKAWNFTYRLRGPTEWLSLGTYPALSLAAARTLALEKRRLVDAGQNPAAEKRAAKTAPPPEPLPPAFTFDDMSALYLVVAKGRKKTAHEDALKIDKYLRPAWGTRPLRSIGRPDVHELLDTLVTNGLTIGVNRIQALISRIFTVALDRSLIDAHPAARMIKRFDEQPGERVLTDDELRALWAGLDAHQGAASDAVRLRLLLGQRGEEVAGMTWAELDLDAQLWALPGVRTKNGRPHAVPLPPTAHALLTRRHAARAADALRVFPGLTLQSVEHKALATIHGGAYEWKDLRRTCATRLAGLGFDETTIGRTLNHARVTVTARHYNQHAYLTETRQALEAWDRELQRILQNNPKSAGRVVAMRRP